MMTTTKYRKSRSRLDLNAGFQLLDNTNDHQNYYLNVINNNNNYDLPNPPRAPEPYKISAASSTMSRAHRRSSFVIIADNENFNNQSRSDNNSPTNEARGRSRSPLSPSRINNRGRASPFRPRGFKGPLPHAQSRPPSPPQKQPTAHRRRFVKPKSLSQGNSPRKQSLIPQPRGGHVTTRNNKMTTTVTTAATNNNNKPSEGRWDRRGSRKQIINNNNNNNTKIPRSSSLKIPQQQVRRPLIEATKKLAISNKIKSSVPSSTTTKSSKQLGVKSPTKIPIRNSFNFNNGRFIQVANLEKTKNPINNNNNDNNNNNNNDSNEIKNNDRIIKGEIYDSSPLVTDESSVIVADNNSSSDKKKNDKKLDSDGELGLVDLLKQSSGASGTSSVVNAATTTAVQPLRIDASSILPQEVMEIKDTNNDNNKNKNDVKKPNESLLNVTTVKLDNDTTSQIQSKDDTITISSSGTGGQKIATIVEVEKIENNNSNNNNNIEAIVEIRKKDDVKIDKDEQHQKINNNTNEIENVHVNNSIDVNIVETRGNVGSTVENKRDSNQVTPLKKSNEEKQQQSSTIDKQSNINNNNHGKHGSEVSLKSSKSSKSNGQSSVSVGSIKSTDTGVSLNTVRGLSSAREKHGTHVVKRTDEIETLSGNITQFENHENAESTVIEVTNSSALPPEIRTNSSTVDGEQGNTTRIQKFRNWKNSFGERFRKRLSSMKCFNWHRFKNQRKKHIQRPTTARDVPKKNIFTRFKAAFCRSFRWKSKIAPAESTNCCRKEGGCCSFLCKKPSWCKWPSCCKSCCSCSCCQRDETRSERSRSIRAKHSLTSVAPPPITEEQKSKIPEILVEHNSVMRGAIPCLPVPLAWFCLVWNILLPGSGTVWSGLFNLCVGQPRFAVTTSARGRFGAFIVNIVVGISQLFTVLFCLVGWGWSIWWGVTMLRLARKWKRFKATEAINGDPEAREGAGVLPAPGVPVQALRGVERAR